MNLWCQLLPHTSLVSELYFAADHTSALGVIMNKLLVYSSVSLEENLEQICTQTITEDYS